MHLRLSFRYTEMGQFKKQSSLHTTARGGRMLVKALQLRAYQPRRGRRCQCTIETSTHVGHRIRAWTSFLITGCGEAE